MKGYHKIIKEKVVEPKKGFRYWIDSEGNLCSTDINNVEYIADIKLKQSDRAKKRSEKIAREVKIKATKKAKKLQILEEKKQAILNA